MIQLLAMIVGSLLGYLPHLLFGNRLSFFADFMLGTAVGGAGYVFVVYKLKSLLGG